MERTLVKYRAYLFGNGDDKTEAVRLIEQVFPGTKVYELVEPDAYSFTRKEGFAEADLNKIADTIINAVPELSFILDIMHYDVVTTVKLIKVRFNYSPGKLRIYYDLI